MTSSGTEVIWMGANNSRYNRVMEGAAVWAAFYRAN